MLRTAIIGAGWIGCGYVEPDRYDSSRPSRDNHAKAYTTCKDTELLGIFDKDLNKAVACADIWNAPVCGDDYFNMGELGLDIVSICTPPQTHLEVVKDVILCNPMLKAIYCEKPITIDLDEAREMVRVCREANVILQINHQRRFGRPTFFYSRGLFDTGTHMVDLLRMYFGEVTEVSQNTIHFRDISIDIQEINDNSRHIFELGMPTHNLIYKGVEHLVDCIANKHDSISNGEQGLADLEVLWKLKG